MKRIQYLFFAFAFFSLTACENGKTIQKKSNQQVVEKVAVNVPVFSGDSAFSFVAAQTAFGPRVPNNEAHIKGGNYLITKLESFADTVFVQEFQARAYDGTVLNGRNIIASFDIENKNRIFLSAHWDSRPFADHDPDEANHKTAIDGANDGASGVGIIIELARLMQIQKPNVGIDLILFDLEDYGTPEFAPRNANSENTWALGSQYWAMNPHKADYRARYGVLLDMVGAKNAVFRME
ncbi:MAG: M28 family peptidase, partial [Bacteroidales bacterium]|nr:M28 family peptidase [Bacteroidales bacterium]